MATTSDKTSARNRARQALAEKQKQRRERDGRMEAAATQYFAAADAIEKAQRDAGDAIKSLVDEGETRNEIAKLLGTTTREIKTALDFLTDENTAPGTNEVVSAPEQQSAGATTHENHNVA